MPSKNSVTIASAGSGKTTGIVEDVLAHPDVSALITTFTLSNIAEVKRKFIELNGFVPANVTILPWFTFVLRDLVRPYQNHFFRPRRTRSINLVAGRSDMYARKSDKQRYFFGKSPDIYSDKISEFALNCNDASDGKSLARLERLYQHVYIDEVQDLAGYDLDLLKLFLGSKFDVTLIGDHRQATLATNQSPKYKKYRYAGIIDLFKIWEAEGLCELQFKAISHRCRQEICDFSNQIFPDDLGAESTNETMTGHDGVFIVPTAEVSSYISEFSPQVLRYNKNSKCEGFPAMNFRISKGLTFERTLIFPHKGIQEYLTGGDLSKLKEPHLLYVAVTRARQSVAFVFDEVVNVPNITG